MIYHFDISFTTPNNILLSQELNTMTIKETLEANSDCSVEQQQKLKDELLAKLTSEDIYRLVDKHLPPTDFLTLLYEMSEEESFECDN